MRFLGGYVLVQGVFWVLLEALGTVLGFIFAPIRSVRGSLNRGPTDDSTYPEEYCMQNQQETERYS